MKAFLGMIAFLACAVVLGGVLAQPYFQPAQPWPDWLILIAGLSFVIVCMIFWPRHKSPKQILDDYEELVWQEKDGARTLDRAKKERWTADAIRRMETEQLQLRGRIQALRNDSSR